MLRPRATFLAAAPANRVVGVLLICFSLSILTPLPSTNTVPGIAVALIALGLLERDGVFIGFGAAVGVAWIAALIFAGRALFAWLNGSLA